MKCKLRSLHLPIFNRARPRELSHPNYFLGIDFALQVQGGVAGNRPPADPRVESESAVLVVDPVELGLEAAVRRSVLVAVEDKLRTAVRKELVQLEAA